MYKKLLLLSRHSLIKGSAIVFGGTAIINGLNYVFHLITGRMLGPDQYSILAALISLSYVIGFPATLINTLITQKIAAYAALRDNRGMKTFLFSMTRHVALLAVLIVMAFVILQSAIASFLHIEQKVLVLLLGLEFAFSLLVIIPLATLQGLLRFISFSALSILSAFLRVVFSYGAILLGLGVLGVLYGMFGSILVTGIVALFMLPTIFSLSKKGKSPAVSAVKPYWLYAFQSTLVVMSSINYLRIQSHFLKRFTLKRYFTQKWIAVALLGKGLLINVDVLLVKHFFESYDAGLYAAMATMGKIVLFFASSLSIVLLPIATQKHAKGKSAVKELLLAQAGIVVLSSVILLAYRVMPELVISLLYGREYFAIAPYLWLFGIYFLLYNMSYTFVNYFISGKHTLILTMPLVISVVQIGGIILFHRSFYDVLSVMIGSASLLILVFMVYFYRYARQQRRIEFNH